MYKCYACRLQLRECQPMTNDHFTDAGGPLLTCKLLENGQDAWDMQGPPSPSASSDSSMSSGIDCTPLSDPFSNSFFDFEVAN
jgi:hypothetical protein